MSTRTNKKISQYLDDQWQKAQENTGRLERCPRHLFDFSKWAELPSLKHVPCLRCQGRAELRIAVAYIKGWLSSGRPVEEVASGLKPGQLTDKLYTCPQCDGKSSPDDPRAWNEVTCNLCDTIGVVARDVALPYLDRGRKTNA